MKTVRKGKEYEKHIKKLLADAGLNVARIPRSGAGDIKGDLWIFLNSGGRLVVECKKQESINIWKCIVQAKQQSRYYPWAIVFSRNREDDDYICMSIKDFVDIAYPELEKQESSSLIKT